MFGLLAAVMLVASFVVPVNLISPAPVEADPGICKWDVLMTPGYLPLKNDLSAKSEILDMAVGGDGATILLVVRKTGTCVEYQAAGEPISSWCENPLGCTGNSLYYSSNNGISFTSAKSLNLVREFQRLFDNWDGHQIYQVAIAPDNPNFWAVTADAPEGAAGDGPVEVWITSNAGSKWEVTNLRLQVGIADDGEFIRAIDISADYGGKRDIAVGTVEGGLGDVYVVKSTGFTGWIDQGFDGDVNGTANTDNEIDADFYAVKFSPTYSGDASLALVYADDAATGTYYNISLRDIDSNQHSEWAFSPLTVKLPPDSALPGVKTGPVLGELNKVDLELPSDFSGQAASLRRAYISLDCFLAVDDKNDVWDGILRVDDTTVYVLMDTSGSYTKSIYSIAYFGTYASGKLLAGERMGYPCTATVPTWFTDSPTTCPIPCWYPALKPTTGAASCVGACVLVGTAFSPCECPTGQVGPGGALVGWRADGNLAFAGTGSLLALPDLEWFDEWANGIPVPNDESAFAVSRNNGETWNQIDIIDTTISKFTDIAPTPDCKTVYLASVNTGATCSGFDSVWRSSSNSEVVSPYPGLPIGIFWERVLTRVTGDNKFEEGSCLADQTDYALLRIVPYCADPSGQIVAWGVYDHDAMFNKGIAAWSPDYGDYWANITPRNPIQDFTFESSTVMYFLSPGGLVQKMPYTGTAWSTTLSDVDTVLLGAHTIAAYPEGKVLVGANADQHMILYAVAYSGNFNTDNPTFTVQALAGPTPYFGNVHVAFDPNFKDNNTYFIADENGETGGGSVYRNSAAAQLRFADTDMMNASNGAVGCEAPHPVGQFGLVLAFTGQALYSAHTYYSEETEGGVCRTIDDGTGKYGPLSGMPKPGIAWDCLIVGLDVAPIWPLFTLEPSSLKACGCCTLDTDTTLYAIDDNNYIPRSVTVNDEICCTDNATAFAALVATACKAYCDPTTYCDYFAGLVAAQVTCPIVKTQQGLVWAFTDCMAKKGPALITADKSLIGCDPVSGRAQEVSLCWEQLCVADAYDIEIAKNTNFSILVIDIAPEGECYANVPVDVTTPCVFFPAGGAAAARTRTIYADEDKKDTVTVLGEGSSIGLYGNLECGLTYYWRVKVRECATGQWVRSPWSEVRSFTVKSGLPVVSTYLGLTLLAPNNGCIGCPATGVSFSWSPYKETTKYEIILAKDPGLTQILKQAQTATTAYEYDGTLDYNTNYFWQVKGIDPPSDPSATFSFRTEAAPSGPVTPEAPAPPPVWVWVVIAIGTILVIVTLVLIFKTRRV